MKTYTFRTEDELQAIIDTEAELHGSITDALKDLIADGLRYRMIVNDPSVHRTFLDPLTPDGAIAEYCHFLEAIRGRAGLGNDDGSAPRYRFVQVPAGGRWEAKGLADAWAVLPENMNLTPDGREIIEPINGEESHEE